MKIVPSNVVLVVNQTTIDNSGSSDTKYIQYDSVMGTQLLHTIMQDNSSDNQ